ncbi:SMI1/KNR4 family protein [Streptomyces gilvus]|uniref:SMI1/KNR4 family protein n=1 Tax=Streptomyces gilvus TaxID=2920937 RepID=UPI001F0E8DCF|nr:SMI1/KNR4 family protein [Streptomyces sp. CME 23]MCH5675166.1 SMI1/KNR4 family protein [Streptomyces sp. CME 23]
MIETTGDDRRFPPALVAVAQVEFDYDDGEGVDFEPYDAFDSAEETTDWLRNWTGNRDVDGDAYRVFGQDGTGGLAALWCVRPGRPLPEQPVVFLGSEGERGVVAGSLSDFLWLLADGLGPLEVVEFGRRDARPNAELTKLAERHATSAHRPPDEIIAEAQAEFATFSDDLDALCR